MSEKLEDILKKSVGGKCKFPESIVTPINTSMLKIENSGQNGDPTDDVRFSGFVKKVLTKKEAEDLENALKK